MATDMQTEKRLTRSRRDRMVFGVCGGLGEYFGIDPVVIRLAFVLVSVAGGAGVLAYLILAIVVPEEPAPGEVRSSTGEPIAPGADGLPDDSAQRRRGSELAGLILLGLGLFFLAANLGLTAWFNWDLFWPFLLIVLGAAMLWRSAGFSGNRRGRP